MAKRKFTSRSRNMYSEFSPPGELNHIIEKFWEFTCLPGKGETITFHLIPDYTSTLLYVRYGNVSKGQLLISGPNTMNIPFKTDKAISVIGARFKPLKLQNIFQISADVSFNKLTNIKTISRRLHDDFFKRITKNSNTENVIDLLCELMSSNLKAPVNSKNVVDEFIGMLLSAGGNIKLSSLYKTLPLSPRHFQRKFLEATGFSPKDFCKILRFHSVTGKLVRNNFDHFDVMVEAGYYDQSHYYKEFKDISGRLPKDFEMRQKTISHKSLVS